MMNKRKSLLAALLAAAALTVAACGGSAPAAGEIRVGGNFELTGNVSNFAQSAYKGVKLAFKEINDKGGVDGKKINLIVADNKSELSEATNATTKLITRDKVAAVIGPIVSASVLASAPLATDSKVPMLTPTGTNEEITYKDGKVREYLFRSCFIDSFQGDVMAKFALNSLKIKNIAILKDNSSDYAKSLAAVFGDTLRKGGGQIVAEEAYLQKDTDFRPTLTKIRASNPEAVFIPGYYQEVGLIVKQARELGITVPLLGSDGCDAPTVVELAGAEDLVNTYFCNHYSVDDQDPNIQKFVASYKKEYNNETPDAFAALGYDAGVMFADAVKRAGGADPQKIKDALAATKNLQVATGKLTLDAKHDPIKSAVIIEMKGGRQTFKEKIN
jgi:branched-chain amino acid transport system substrate-binding protein